MISIRVRTIFCAMVSAVLLGAILPSSASATWSIIAVDGARRVVVISSATCVSARGLRSRNGLKGVQAIVLPGVGVAAAQAGVDGTFTNQRLIRSYMNEGADPVAILRMLSEDGAYQRRQFAILDLQGRVVGFSGSGNSAASLHVSGRVPGTQISFSIQGNILVSDDVVHNAVAAFQQTEGTVEDRVMAAMEAADAAGGDSRCTCQSEPVPDAPCDGKSAHVAYILSAEATDPWGDDFNNGDYSLFIDVDDENIQPTENGNPVITLRMRYDAWKAGQGDPVSRSR